MSYANFVKALELAPQCKFYTTAGGKSDEEIGASEKILGVTFSKQCKEFYKNLGYLSFFGNEIFGIDPYDDSGILEGNSVAYALNDRTELGLPVAWIPIYDYNDGSMAYLDYDIIKSGEQFGEIVCSRIIFISQRFYKFLKEKKLNRGLQYEPIQLA